MLKAFLIEIDEKVNGLKELLENENSWVRINFATSPRSKNEDSEYFRATERIKDVLVARVCCPKQ